MKSRVLDRTSRTTTWVLIFDKGDEVVAILTAFARSEGVSAAQFTAIGAFSDATLGYFDPHRRDYVRIPVPDQVEVVSLAGDVALEGDEPKVHAHVVVSRADGTALGGHLLEGRAWPTLELMLSESPRHLRRRVDPETGLALIDLGAGAPERNRRGGGDGRKRPLTADERAAHRSAGAADQLGIQRSPDAPTIESAEEIRREIWGEGEPR